MAGPTREQTWEDTKKFWKSPGAAKKVLGAAGQTALGGGMVGRAAEQLETTPRKRDERYGVDAGEHGKTWEEHFGK